MKEKEVNMDGKPVSKKGHRGFLPRPDLQNIELRKLIVKLRKKGWVWRRIVEEIKKRFDVKISFPTAKAIFEKEVAKETLMRPKARDYIKGAYQSIQERYERACRWVDKLGNTIDQIYNKYGEAAPEAFIKYAPIILATAREVLNQLEFLKREQERITLHQKNLIYSPIQIVNIVHKKLNELEKQGYIKIIKKIPENESEDEDETTD